MTKLQERREFIVAELYRMAFDWNAYKASEWKRLQAELHKLNQSL